MDVDAETGSQKKDEEEKKADEKKEEKKEELLKNPCRVLPAQMPYIEYFTGAEDSAGEKVRYTPLLLTRKSGFLLLRDQMPDEPEELLMEEKKEADDGEKEPD